MSNLRKVCVLPILLTTTKYGYSFGKTNHMIKVILILPFLFSLTVRGQIVNSSSSDKTNIYFHALDSVVKILKVTESFNKITVGGDRSITQNFPDKVDEVELVKLTDTKKNQKIKIDEARLAIKNVDIIRDQFKITIFAAGHAGRLGDGLFIFRYQYTPETMTYKLKEVRRGIIL